jgi:hypothetical protein
MAAGILDGDCLTPVFFGIIFGDQRNCRGQVQPDGKTEQKSKWVQEKEIVHKGNKKGCETGERQGEDNGLLMAEHPGKKTRTDQCNAESGRYEYEDAARRRMIDSELVFYDR